ncbi:MAG: response regulator transcription factor [Clostridiales bacterium]|nr:response regulator transcription factor [Clostridiales bacterium]
MKRLLLVEDNEMIIKGLTYALTQEQFEVQVCKTAREAESLTGSVVFDIAILDISLPDGNGYDICRHLKEIFPDLPIIFLTAKDEETDVVAGFDAGADDYIIKPFRNRELLSRINNALRRYKKSGALLTSGALSLDPDAERVFRDGVEIPLTALEYRIVSYLFQNQGQTITRDQLLSRIWDLSGNIVNDNTLTVSIKRIREKLGPDAITTVKGLGYRIEKGDA